MFFLDIRFVSFVFVRNVFRLERKLYINGCVVCMYGHHIKQSMIQPGNVANPARGQLNKENWCFPGPARA